MESGFSLEFDETCLGPYLPRLMLVCTIHIERISKPKEACILPFSRSFNIFNLESIQSLTTYHFQLSRYTGKSDTQNPPSQSPILGLDDSLLSLAANAESKAQLAIAGPIYHVSPIDFPWERTMQLARGLLQEGDDDERERICVRMLRSLQGWQPDEAVARIFGYLHKLPNMHDVRLNRWKDWTTQGIVPRV